MTPNYVRHFLVVASMATLGVNSLHAQVPAGPQRERVIRVLPEPVITTKGVAASGSGLLVHKMCGPLQPCQVNIFVKVDPNGDDPTGRTCRIEFPDVLVLKHRNAKVTWNLKEIGSAQNARFADHSGAADGIRIYQDAASPHFNGRVRQPTAFVWERDEDAGDEAHVYLYDISIDHDLGGGRCDVPDPIIVNRD